MVFLLYLNLSQNDWQTAKLPALIVYILLGVIALRQASTKEFWAAASAAGLLTFSDIIRQALTKFAMSWVSLLTKTAAIA